MHQQPCKSFRKSSMALAVSTLIAGLAGHAHGASWSTGDWEISFDSSFSVGTSIRVEERDWGLIANSNQPEFNWSGYDAATNVIYPSADIWDQAKGSYSANGDQGDLNYDKGKPFSTLIKGVHELDIRYDNMGVFLRGMYFYDYELKKNDRDWANPITGNTSNPCDDPTANAELCSDVRLLDAFFYADFDIGNVPVTLRIGDQVVSWGESTFIQHGINTINPIDVSRAVAPGSELKEVFIPVGMVFMSAGLTDNFSVAAYYQYKWDRSRLPQAGSYFSTNDFAGEGGHVNNIQLGFTGNPDINQEFLLSELNGYGAALRAGASASDIASAYLAYPTKVAIRDYGDDAHDEADDQGQYGIKLTYFAEELNQTEFSFYHINYHSQRPVISGVTSNFSDAAIASDLAYMASHEITKYNLTDLKAFTQARFSYPEDIKLYGLSFNTNVGETALAGEVAYRMDEPLQIDDVELLYMGMPEQLANAGIRPDFAGISQLNNIYGAIGPGETAKGYVTSDTVQAQVTASHIFGPKLGTDNLIVLGEVGYVRIQDFPDPSVVRLNGPGTNRSGGIEPVYDDEGNVVTDRAGLLVGISNGPETNPFPTQDAWGYRVLVNADFNNVFSGVNLQARGTFSHDVDGITPDPMFLFIEGRKSASLSLTFDYLSKLSATASYNAYWGGVGTTNTLSDRDFISFNIKYSI